MLRKQISFGEPAHDEEIIAAAVACLKSGWWGSGKICADIEDHLKKLIGTSDCVTVSSGTAALHSALVAADIGHGDDVITTPMTYAATAHAIELVGAKPVFVDIDPETGNIDPQAITAALGPHTAAILPVHFAGRPCDMTAIMEIARFHGLLVIEDCAHAIGARIEGRHVGTFGLAGAFSFNYTKNVAAPSGGAVVSNSPEVAKGVKHFAYCGEERTAWERFIGKGDSSIISLGTNYRPTDLTSSIILPQLRRIDEIAVKRAWIWETYDRGLKDVPIGRPPPVLPGIIHARHLYQIRVSDRTLFRNRMKALGVLTGVHYKALHLEPYYQEKYGYKEGSLLNAEEFGRTTVSLPLSCKLTEEEVEAVIKAVKASI